MIRYRLACAKGHEFEGWFQSSDGCDQQIARKLVQCPECGSAKVAKALMAPSVVTAEQRETTRRRRSRSVPAAPVAPAAAPAPSSVSAMLTPEQRQILKQLRELRDRVVADAEYVGPRFAEEARKIHHEETPERGIYGEASPAEVEDLLRDGIDVMPIPVLPDDHN
jgi:hypothetical protein